MIRKSYIETDDYTGKCLVFDTRDDSLVIKTNFPVLGVGSLQGVVIRSSSDLSFQFRYSKDGVIWSDWKDLTNLELQNISDSRNKHPFEIEYFVLCNSDIPQYLIDIRLEITYDEVSDPIKYEKTPFSDFFPFKNKASLTLSSNILKKIFYRGIIPRYIDRKRNENWEDVDYLDFWWTIIYLNSLKTVYNNVFKELLFRPELLIPYLEQKSLITPEYRDLGQLYYLSVYYYNEIRRRGTNLMLQEGINLPLNYYNVTIDGEILRLLNVKENDIERYRLPFSDLGWVVGASSPTYTSPTNLYSMVKGYDKMGEFNVLNYPTIGDITNVKDIVFGVEKDVFKCNLSSEISGLGYDTNKKIRVNNSFSYEITFLVRCDEPVNFRFGVQVFNDASTNMGTVVRFDNFNFETNDFIDTVGFTTDGKYQFVRGIIYQKNIVEVLDATLNIGIGHHLKFPTNKDIVYIVPYVVFTDNGGSAYISDLRISPAYIDGCRYVSQERVSYLRSKYFSNRYSVFEIKQILSQKLIPYNSELIFETEESLKEFKTYLFTDVQTLRLGALSGSTKHFELTSNVRWSINKLNITDTWFQLSISEGNGSKRIFVTSLTDNTTGQLRTAIIRISNIGGSDKIDLTINQE